MRTCWRQDSCRQPSCRQWTPTQMQRVSSYQVQLSLYFKATFSCSLLALLEEVTLYDGRLPAVHARHERVPGAGGEGGRSGPHQLAPLHPRAADPERGQGGH